jgi:hypothetical protein
MLTLRPTGLSSPATETGSTTSLSRTAATWGANTRTGTAGRSCGGTGPSLCTSTPSWASPRAGGRQASKTPKRNSWSAGTSAPPTRLLPRPFYLAGQCLSCVCVPFRRGLLHRASQRVPHARPTVRFGCTKSSTIRVIARKEGKRVRLYSRPGNDLTHRFPLIVQTLGQTDGPGVASMLGSARLRLLPGAKLTFAAWSMESSNANPAGVTGGAYRTCWCPGAT